jgi:long-subunit fatty acid transport protein
MPRALSLPASCALLAVASIGLLVRAVPVGASQLLPMAVGAADMGMGGATIAEPLSPSGALFANPAGLCSFDETTMTTSIGVGWGSEKINNDAGYSEKNDLVVAIPDFGIAFAGHGRWRYGFGTYGNVGANYDFDADPAAGVDNDFHAETTILAMPFALAYRVSDQLYLGVELIGLFGHLRNRYTAGGQLFRYTLRGPGVQGMFGVTWKPADRWSVGLSLRTPGRIWMDGSAAVPATVRRDVDLAVEMPTQISLGITHKFLKMVSVSASTRWTDSSRFKHSDIEFDGLSAANVPFIPAARDEWRFGLAFEIKPTPDWTFRLGANHSNRIVGTSGVSPLVFDNEDTRLSAGVGVRIGEWNIDSMFGYAFHRGRDVSADDALVIPGHFDSGGGIFMLGLTRKL